MMFLGADRKVCPLIQKALILKYVYICFPIHWTICQIYKLRFRQIALKGHLLY